MKKEKYRLPDYTFTNDQGLYIKTWRKMGERLLKLFFKKEDAAYIIGFDPDFLLGDNKRTLNIPSWAATNLLNGKS